MFVLLLHAIWSAGFPTHQKGKISHESHNESEASKLESLWSDISYNRFRCNQAIQQLAAWKWLTTEQGHNCYESAGKPNGKPRDRRVSILQ